MFSRAEIAERLGGFVYGTIVVLSVIVAGAKAYPDDTTRIAVLVVVTTIVFWLAHAYAHALAESVRSNEHLTVTEVRRIGRHEAPLVQAGVPSIAVLLLGSLGLFDSDTGDLAGDRTSGSPCSQFRGSCSPAWSASARPARSPWSR